MPGKKRHTLWAISRLAPSRSNHPKVPVPQLAQDSHKQLRIRPNHHIGGAPDEKAETHTDHLDDWHGHQIPCRISSSSLMRTKRPQETTQHCERLKLGISLDCVNNVPYDTLSHLDASPGHVPTLKTPQHMMNWKNIPSPLSYRFTGTKLVPKKKTAMPGKRVNTEQFGLHTSAEEANAL